MGDSAQHPTGRIGATNGIDLPNQSRNFVSEWTDLLRLGA